MVDVTATLPPLIQLTVCSGASLSRVEVTTIRGEAGFWSVGGSNFGVVDESSPQANIFFLVARCFWCVFMNCEIELNLVIFHVTCLKHMFISDPRVLGYTLTRARQIKSI